MDRVLIKKESKERLEKKMIRVLKSSDFKVSKEIYSFRIIDAPLIRPNNNVLAFVRDGYQWSSLSIAQSDNMENDQLYTIFSFHFKNEIDNSGFVGWLATKIKKEFGSGVFVVCGFNSDHGGIYDYWGCPIQIGQKVVNYIEAFRNK